MLDDYDSESYSANDYLQALIKGRDVAINNLVLELWELCDLIDSELLSEAAQETLTGDKDAIVKLFLKEIQSIMDN